jgi:hypothetical protein
MCGRRFSGGRRLLGWLSVLAAFVLGAPLGAGLGPHLALAQAVWLDEPLSNWNSPGMGIPAAPPGQPSGNPNCTTVARPAETAADEALGAAGWTLYGSYTGGWGVTIVKGMSGQDGMCRPLGYQEFVFVDDTFAGTLSPTPMDSRADASGDLTSLQSADRLTATFQRYRPSDPLCCPSVQQAVTYRIERSDAGPLLVPERVGT